MKVNDLKTKKILILGLGKEGINTLQYLRLNFPTKLLGVADELPFEKLNPLAKKLITEDENLNLHLGQECLTSLSKYQVVIKTPGFSPFRPAIRKAQKQGVTITSQTEVFFANCPGKIIGVTGSKGKGTTTSLIYRVLKKGGLDVRLVGNIGKPGLLLLPQAKPETVFVDELSSYQLLGMKQSPAIAVFLNFYQEHLDYHPSLKNYFQAKANITLHQKPEDYFTYNYSQPILQKLSKQTAAQKIPFSLTKKPCPGYFVEKGKIIFCRSPKVKEAIFSTKDNPFRARFYLENIMAAIAVGHLFNIERHTIARAIKNFIPLPHRLEYMGAFQGINFYNDSFATIPEATIRAIESLKNVRTVLLGGYERHQDFTSLAKTIFKANIRTLILFPPTGKRIWQAVLKLKPKKLPAHFSVQNMSQAVRLAYQHTSKGKICLLSPASPSFGIFRDFKQRGNLFKRYARELAKK